MELSGGYEPREGSPHVSGNVGNLRSAENSQFHTHNLIWNWALWIKKENLTYSLQSGWVAPSQVCKSMKWKNAKSLFQPFPIFARAGCRRAGGGAGKDKCARQLVSTGWSGGINIKLQTARKLLNVGWWRWWWSRVGKCHGYDGYIRVKKLASWGKKFGRPK